MREELRTGSSAGMSLQGLTFGQKVLSCALACVVTIVLLVLPNIL
jgi:hypothetical protein